MQKNPSTLTTSIASKMRRPLLIEGDIPSRRFIGGTIASMLVILGIVGLAFAAAGTPSATPLFAACMMAAWIATRLEARLGGSIVDQSDGFLLLGFLVLEPAQALVTTVVVMLIQSFWAPRSWFRVFVLGRTLLVNAAVLAVAITVSTVMPQSVGAYAALSVAIVVIWRITEVLNDGLTEYLVDHTNTLRSAFSMVLPDKNDVRAIVVMSLLTLSTAFTGWACASIHPALITLVALPPIIAWYNSVLEFRVTEAELRAGTDSLTGLLNRGRFFDRLDDHISSASRYHAPLSVILCDLDNFKRVNDTLGHLTGDEVLRATADGIRKVLDPNIFPIARYGGEEFIIALPISKRNDVLELAERIRASVALHLREWETTISIGVSYFVPNDRMESLVDRADKGLYAAKYAGKNQVCEWPERSTDDIMRAREDDVSSSDEPASAA